MDGIKEFFVNYRCIGAGLIKEFLLSTKCILMKMMRLSLKVGLMNKFVSGVFHTKHVFIFHLHMIYNLGPPFPRLSECWNRRADERRKKRMREVCRWDGRYRMV